MREMAYMGLPIVACLFAARHSLRVRGPALTGLFFLCALTFSELRGLVDANRPASEMAQITHLDLWMSVTGRDYGTFLVMMPALRSALAYLCLLIAERACSPRNVGALRLCAIALLAHAMLGALLEVCGQSLGWWEYQQTPEVNPGVMYHFIKGINWSGGIFQPFFLARVESERIERPMVVAGYYMGGYFGLLTIFTLLNPSLRTIVFGPFNVALVLTGFFVKGPPLSPLRLRNAPDENQPIVASTT